mgnify:CR=1 FL=1
MPVSALLIRVAAVAAFAGAIYLGFPLRNADLPLLGHWTMRRPAGEPSDATFEPSKDIEFLNSRNSVEITVPRGMSRDELIRLFQLEQVRAAIPEGPFRADQKIPVGLTPSSAN